MYVHLGIIVYTSDQIIVQNKSKYQNDIRVGTH
jgi:hypothetical protein